MKKVTFVSLLLVVFVIVSVLPAMAERGDDTKRKSKNGKTEGVIDGVNIVIEYGRPKVKGRVIWGDLVPFDKIWRAGADEATTMSFSKDVLIEGKELAAGAYSFFTIPGKEEWVIIFNKVAKQWGAFRYDQAQDALRVKVKCVKVDHVEELTYKIAENKIALCWEKCCVPFVVKAK